MADNGAKVLVLNCGSSSVKFAAFDGLERRLSGSLGGIGSSNPSLAVKPAGGPETRSAVGAKTQAAAVDVVLKTLHDQHGMDACSAVGHRLVHGGPDHFDPTKITDSVLDDLRQIVDFAPEHLPQAIALIEAVGKRFPTVPQVACFDTAFHRDLPPVAKTLPLPHQLTERGVRRYGFHGLSYQFLMDRLEKAGEAGGRIILAHLGNGASMAAVKDGKPIDTTMGMTPAGGLVMSTRAGDIDPGMVRFLEKRIGMTPKQFDKTVNHESGLIGISGTTGDVRELLKAAATDPRAAVAVDLFCYSARKWVGSFAAALGGLDKLVFSGGIGEHLSEIRRKICGELGFLGIELDPAANEQHASYIGSAKSAVSVRVIPTDEEMTILRGVRDVLFSN